jgi:plastocyanin
MALRSRAAAVALLAVLAPVVASCATGASASPVATSSVDLPPSYKFAPPAIEIASGTTVTWTNHDNFTHSVQFLDGGLPGTPMLMDPGQRVTFTFSHPGTYHYQCSLHPQNMQGTVSVTS